jgi:hypothetical protein
MSTLQQKLQQPLTMSEVISSARSSFGNESDEERGGRERWNSRIGFYLAAVGSAVGFGNVWRFPVSTLATSDQAAVLITHAMLPLSFSITATRQGFWWWCFFRKSSQTLI